MLWKFFSNNTLTENSTFHVKITSSWTIQNYEMTQIIPTRVSNIIYYCETVPE